MTTSNADAAVDSPLFRPRSTSTSHPFLVSDLRALRMVRTLLARSLANVSSLGRELVPSLSA